MCQKSKIILITAVIVVLKGSISSCEQVTKAIRPLKYKLSFQTNIHEEDFNFLANVRIKVNILEEIDVIVLNSINLAIHSISVLNETETDEIMSNLGVEQINETIKIELPGPLLKDVIYVLDIHYTGIMHSNFYGFYKSSNSESKKYFVNLSFQTTKFSYFCPSFDDEVGIRTVFEIEVKHYKTYSAISNSKSHTVSADEFITTKFLPTENLPITSIAIIVSNFESISQTNALKEIKIYGKDEIINSCYIKYAMDTGHEVLSMFHTYFSSAYDLSSLKLVILPDIISEVSTYELIIYNQYHLTYQSAKKTTAQKDKILRSITQTFAQQFFGNIVSVSSLEETFITGGFARFYEFLIADMLKPDDRIMSIYNINILQRALEIDSLVSTDAINKIQVDNINQLPSAKFLSLLRMYEEVVGADKLQENVLDFIRKYKFQSITAEMFYNDFNENEKLYLQNFFKFWTQNPGYPLIEIIGRNETSITIAQSRFTIFSSEILESNPKWTIPITYLTSNGDQNDEIIQMDSEEMTLNIQPYSWIILNINQIGYYRVNYDLGMWTKIINALNSPEYESIPVLNRAAILDDALNLAIANKISYELLFDILSYLKYEKDLAPWKIASYGLQYIDMKMTNDQEIYKKFKMFVVEIVKPIYNQYGLSLKTAETSFERELREIAIFWMCKMKDESCLNYVNTKFIEYTHGPDNIHPDLQFAVLCNAIRYADIETFLQLMNIMLSYKGNREILIKSLACTEDYESLIFNLVQQYSNTELSNNDKRFLMISVIENYKYSIDACFELLSKFLTRFDKSEVSFMVNAIVKRIWKQDNNAHYNITVNKFISTGYMSSNEENLFLNIGAQNLKWIDENREEIRYWLNEHMKPSVTETSTEIVTSTESTISTDETTPDRANDLKISQSLVFIILVLWWPKFFE